MSYNSKYTGEQVEALLDIVSQGGSGGGGEGEVQKTTELEILAMGFTKNLGTITEVKMNGQSKGSSGVVDLGTVITAHQDISGKQDVITDLESIRDGANKGATALQEIPSEYITESELEGKNYATTSALNNKMDKVTLAAVATSGSYNDLSNKPTIPDAVTETTVSGWGFTKNTGTYSKPSGGIPKSDLDSSVQTSLGKADTALQSYTEQYKGTVTEVKINGSTKSPSNGVVDLGTVITAHQDISGKQDKLVSGTSIKTVNGESLLGSGDITISGGSGGGSTSIIDTASSATQTTPKMLITLTKYSSTTPDGFAEGSFFTVDFTSKSISASTAGYPYYINVGGTHYKCVTTTGVEMTKNNYATLSGYYTFVRVGTTFVLVNESTNSSSGGSNSSAYPQVNHGTSDTTFTLTPNTFHVWDVVGSITLTLGAEISGVANEYLFQFTCGSYPTSLTLPDTILWADKNFTTNANKTYQISILNGYAVGIEFGKNLITFYIDGILYQAEEGMTYGQWVDSSYNTKGYYIHSVFNKLTDGSNMCESVETNRDTVIIKGIQIYLDSPAL